MFRHRLALQLGCTVEELSARLSSSALTRWMAFYELDPWGSWRDNFHMARLAALYTQAHSKPNAEISLSDFFYQDPEQAHQDTQEAIRLRFLALAGVTTKK